MPIDITITTIFHNEGRSYLHPWTDEDAKSRRGYIDSDGNLNVPWYKEIEGSCYVTDYGKWFDIITANKKVRLLEAINEDEEYNPRKLLDLPLEIRGLEVDIVKLDRGINIFTQDKSVFTITFTGRIYL